MNDHDVEISSWADVDHETDGDDPAVVAYDKVTGEQVGRLTYFVLEPGAIHFKNVEVHRDFRRRRVATALLRYLNACRPDDRINPGVRNHEGNAFMDHILANEADKVATNGILNVPLRTMAFFPGFDLANAQRLAAGAQ